MKKAVINQMFLGFLLLSGLVTYVATLSDEKLAKRKVYDLQNMTIQSMKTLGGTYFKAMSGDITTGDVDTTVPSAMCQAEIITNQLLQSTTLGQELLDSGSIEYIWKDAGTYDPNTETYDNDPDGRPDTITVTVAEQTSETYWYKFLDKDSFSIPEFGNAVDLNKFNYNVDVSFRGVIEAGYYNMVGTYELDEFGCPTNAELILADKRAWEDKIGERLTTIEMPKTRMFFIADGYRRFGDYSTSYGVNGVGRNTEISLDTPVTFDCSEEYPTAILETSNLEIERSDESYDLVTYDTSANLTSRANVYFQDTEFNFDPTTDENGDLQETEHMNEIAEKDWGAFVAFMEESNDWNDEANEYADGLTTTEKFALASLSGDYAGWLTYAEAKGIDFSYDPNGEYVFVSEDLASTTDTSDTDLRHDKWASDFDFSDMSFSMEKIFVPEPVDLSLINDDSVMDVDCDLYN